MRQITLIILSFLIAATASARCSNSGISSLSDNPILNRNGLIILEFYASSQDLVAELNKKHPVYLQSSFGKVKLNILEILRGEMSLTQVVLKPAAGLKAGEVYALHIQDLPKHERPPGRYNGSTNKWEPLTFKISSSADNYVPILNAAPTEQRKSLVHYGCGPARWVYFNIAAEDASELFVRATVKNKATGLTSTYILIVEKGMVKLGHGMCSGAFHFDSGDNFEVAFQLFDQSGNQSTLSDAIAFTKPTVPTNEE